MNWGLRLRLEHPEAQPPNTLGMRAGKPEAYRTVLRQSRENSNGFPALSICVICVICGLIFEIIKNGFVTNFFFVAGDWHQKEIEPSHICMFEMIECLRQMTIRRTVE